MEAEDPTMHDVQQNAQHPGAEKKPPHIFMYVGIIKLNLEKYFKANNSTH